MKKLRNLLLLSAVSCQIYAQTNNANTEQLTAELQSIATNGPIVGFSVAVVNEEGTLYENGFGSADILANQNQIKL